MEKELFDFHHPPTVTDPDALFAILEAQVGSYITVPAQRDSVAQAYRYAAQAHQGMSRDSGEPYIIHPLHVALILSCLQLDTETLVAALLHDVIEDTPRTYDDLAREFGPVVARLVDGVTKLNLLSKWSKQEYNAVNILKVIMSMSDDVRVILVKLADRLHNLRTLIFKQQAASRERVAREALEVYARIADRLGIAILRKEIEDIAFSYLDPLAYSRIKESIESRYTAHASQIAEIERDVLGLLSEWNIQVEGQGIQVNPRRVYDMYHRLREEADPRQDTLRRVSPHLRFLVFVSDVPSCYLAVAAVHARWSSIASEMRDYISSPLPNGYQSLHTTVFIDRMPIKFQIRTMQMHRTAQLGIIAHMQDEGWKSKYASLKETIDALGSLSEGGLETVDDPLEFLDTLKTEELESVIYVYTPKGETIKLPVGSTPVDLAYRVHTEVGNRCIGALVDGHWVPLNRPLRTGERVEILTSDQAMPSFDWLNPDLGYTASPLAREKIRRWFRRHAQGTKIGWGRQQLRRVIERLSLEIKDLSALAKRWGCESERDLFLQVGGCQVAIESLLPDLLDIYGKSQLPTMVSSMPEESIMGVGSLDKQMAACCSPKPGDDIVGYIGLPRHIVEVHRSNCPVFVKEMFEDKTRFIAVHWGKVSQTYAACMQVRGHDRPSFLRDVLNVLYEEEINVSDIQVKVKRALDALMTVCIDISSWIQFNRILSRIDDLPGVIQVRRVVQEIEDRTREESVMNRPVRSAIKDSLSAYSLTRFFASGRDKPPRKRL